MDSDSSNTASPNDYDSASQSTNLPTHSSPQMASVTIVNDACYEAPETFTVTLTVGGGGVSCIQTGSPSSSQITITDDDCKFVSGAQLLFYLNN